MEEGLPAAGERVMGRYSFSNPIRFSTSTEFDVDDVLDRMLRAATKFNVEKIKPQDLAGAAGPPDEET